MLPGQRRVGPLQTGLTMVLKIWSLDRFGGVGSPDLSFGQKWIQSLPSTIEDLYPSKIFSDYV